MAIGEAIDENPALELEDTAICPICGRPTSGEPCVVCRASLAESPPPRSEETSAYETEYRASGTADPDFDPMTLIASADDVLEELLEAAMASLDSEREQAVAMLLIDAIDERGFLCVDLREVASLANEPLASVERILGDIQQIAPPGVGARSLQECLLLQVAYLRDEGIVIPEGAEAIIADHLEELGAKRMSRIARALGLELEQVETARAFIRDQLTPHPLQSHQSHTWTAPSSGGHVVPDVVVTVDGDHLRIEVPNAVYDRLRTNSLYHAIARPGSAPERSENGTDPEPQVAGVDQVVDQQQSIMRNRR